MGQTITCLKFVKAVADVIIGSKPSRKKSQHRFDVPEGVCYNPVMLSEQERQTIVSLATRYRVKKILLFGSNATAEKEGRDIDLAVDGIQARDFFKFYLDLLFGLKRAVDLIDLSSDSKFNNLVRREGIPIYG